MEDKQNKLNIGHKIEKKDPFSEIMEDLDAYQEGCDKRELTDSGE